MKNIFLIVLLFLATFTFAQVSTLPAKLNWGPQISEPTGTYISKIISSDSEGFYALRKREIGTLSPKPKIWVESYSKGMKLRKSEEIDLKYNKKVRDFEDIISLDGNLYLLTSYNNQAKNKNYLFSQKLNNRFQPERELSLLGEIDAKNLLKEGRFDTHISSDSSKVLIYNQLPYERNTPERFAFRVFDEKMKEIWHKNVILPYNDDVFSVKEYQVDRSGNVYLLGVIYENKNMRGDQRGRPAYRYVLLAYMNNGEEKEEYEMDLGDKFITDLTFKVTKDKRLVFAGFYSVKSSYNAKGTCYFQIDVLSKQMIKKNIKEFDFDFITEELSESAKKRAARAEDRGNERKEAELYRYNLDELILRSDGGAVLVAEQFYVYQQTANYGYNGRIARNYYYNYNDIIVVNIEPSGEIEWTSRIPKRQSTVNDGGYFSSYAMSITRGKLYFVYNDNRRNLEENRARRRLFDFTGNESILALSEIDMKGNVTTFPIESTKAASVYTRPKICKQIGKKAMAIYGEDGRRYRFGSLDFL